MVAGRKGQTGGRGRFELLLRLLGSFEEGEVLGGLFGLAPGFPKIDETMVPFAQQRSSRAGSYR